MFIVKRIRGIVRYEWSHRELFSFLLILFLTLYLYFTGYLEILIYDLGQYGYIGSFVAGFFYTSAITTSFSVAYFLLENLNPFLSAVIGGFGAIFADYVIYSFVRKESGRTFILLNKEIRFPKIKNKLIIKLSPLIAGFIIASPLPDELAALLFGLEKYDKKKFIIISFVFNFLGILTINLLGRTLL